MGEWKAPPNWRANGGGKKGMVKPPRVLAVMRRVTSQPEGDDRNEEERQWRQLLKSAPEEFLRQMTELEKKHHEALAKFKAMQARQKLEKGPEPVATQPAAQTPTDPGTVRVTELIERLLGEWELSVGTAGGAR